MEKEKIKCDICGKELPPSNQHTRMVDGKTLMLCGKHYSQYVKYGKFLDNSQKTVFDSNDFKVDGDITYVYTTNKNNEVSGFFKIDTEDLDRVIIHKWRLWHDNFFTGVQKPISIYHFIMNVPIEQGQIIDHINHDRSDNRKCNLRICTQQQNICNQALKNTNTSGFSGIYFDKSRDKWVVEIKCNYVKCHLGRYEDINKACFVRYEAEKLVFGDYRNTSNDEKLIANANQCDDKEQLLEYVKRRIAEKYPNLSK